MFLEPRGAALGFHSRARCALSRLQPLREADNESSPVICREGKKKVTSLSLSLSLVLPLSFRGARARLTDILRTRDEGEGREKVYKVCLQEARELSRLVFKGEETRRGAVQRNRQCSIAR